jgi:hypothetical protein
LLADPPYSSAVDSEGAPSQTKNELLWAKRWLWGLLECWYVEGLAVSTCRPCLGLLGLLLMCSYATLATKASRGQVN